MFENERSLNVFLLDYADKLLEGIEDSSLADLPAPGLNHPAWIVGHLGLVSDYGLQLLGRPTACARSWHVLFGPGSTAEPDRARYPAKVELVEAMRRGYETLAGAAAEADPAAMAAPHPFEVRFLREGLPTAGQLLSHILTTHIATHLGQFSAWRRLRGMPGVLQL